MIMRRVEFKAPDLREIRAGRLPEITKFSMFLGILKQSALYQHKPRGLIKAPESVPRYNRIPALKICPNGPFKNTKKTQEQAGHQQAANLSCLHKPINGLRQQLDARPVVGKIYKVPKRHNRTFKNRKEPSRGRFSTLKVIFEGSACLAASQDAFKKVIAARF